jgi:integral membrane sensor domain MASE1
MIPPAMVLAMAVSAILQIMYPHGFLGLLAPAAYVIGCLLASLIGAYRAGIKYLFVLPVVFAAIHFSWGVGFFFGLMVFGIPGFSQPREATNRPGSLKTSGGGRTHDQP